MYKRQAYILARPFTVSTLSFTERPIHSGPVSYTHLDVYKRQITWSAMNCCKLNMDLLGLASHFDPIYKENRIKAVSL